MNRVQFFYFSSMLWIILASTTYGMLRLFSLVLAFACFVASFVVSMKRYRLLKKENDVPFIEY